MTLFFIGSFCSPKRGPVWRRKPFISIRFSVTVVHLKLLTFVYNFSPFTPRDNESTIDSVSGYSGVMSGCTLSVYVYMFISSISSERL